MELTIAETRTLIDAIENALHCEPHNEKALWDLHIKLKSELANAKLYAVSYLINYADGTERDIDYSFFTAKEFQDNLGSIPGWLEVQHNQWSSCIVTINKTGS
jgi:hypothetical protein